MATTKRKARIAEREWEKHKDAIINLYLTQELTLDKLAEEMSGRLDAR